MATFLTHTLFGISTAYAVSQPQKVPKKFLILSTLCQCLTDFDSLSYLLPITVLHPLAHRGLAHSGIFARAIALLVMQSFYRQQNCVGLRWSGRFIWFFLITLCHGIFDGMVALSLGVAYFWPFDAHRYHLLWQPFVDVPIDVKMLVSGRFWYAVLVECSFFSCLIAILFLLKCLAFFSLYRFPFLVPSRFYTSLPQAHTHMAVTRGEGAWL